MHIGPDRGPRKPFCGARARRETYWVDSYYRHKGVTEVLLGGVWCLACIEHLSPLDELANTEL